MNNLEVYNNAKKVTEAKSVKAALKAGNKEFTSISQVIKLCGQVKYWELYKDAFIAVGILSREMCEFKNIQSLFAPELWHTDKKGNRTFGILREVKVTEEVEVYRKDGSQIMLSDGTPMLVKVETGKVEIKWGKVGAWTPSKLIDAIAQSNEYRNK